MRKPAAGPIIGAILLGCLCGKIAGQNAGPSPPRDLAVFVPAAAETPGWTIKGEAQRFAGEDLYIYIDGGAEIFNEYGFRRVLAQDFESKDGRGVTLEIYEMADPAAAFGIYSFQTSGKGRPAGFGTDGEIEEYYLRFWKGPYLVAVTGFEAGGRGGGNLLEGVIAVARATDARMKEAAGPPSFVKGLPREWIKPGFKYLRGVLGLNNIRPFFTRDVLKFREAAAVPVEGGWLFVFGYSSRAEAETRLAEIRAAMSSGESYRDVRAFSDGHVEASDSKGNQLFARTSGNKIGLVSAPRAAEIAGGLLSLIR